MAIDPYHRYSNESEIPDKDIYDNFKLTKTFDSMVYIKQFSVVRDETAKMLTLVLLWPDIYGVKDVSDQ